MRRRAPFWRRAGLAAITPLLEKNVFKTMSLDVPLVFSLTRTSFDLTVVAAMLAVIGYSLNDTVVVFDRIRERFAGNRRLPPATILDQSINQTLSRTIMTKVVTAIVVVALLVLGGPVLRGFSEALMIGIIAGTYSSIYISSAIALDCGLTAEHVFPTVKKSAVDQMP